MFPPSHHLFPPAGIKPIFGAQKSREKNTSLIDVVVVFGVGRRENVSKVDV